MRIRIDDFGRRRRGPRRAILRSTIALAFAAAVALAASVTNAKATAREISASSYGFADSPWTNNALERPRTQSPVGGGFRCPVNCGPAFGTYVVRRNELLTSNNVERSGKKVVDATGHAMDVGGLVVIERLEPTSFGADWFVEGERTLDSNGTHSCPAFRGMRLGSRATFTGSRPLRLRWTSQRERPLAAPPRRRPG